MTDSILVTREDLYELVWTIPTQRLAERFGISDVALAKICKKLKVPKPPRGYWAQIAAGYKPHRAVLTKVVRGQREQVVIYPSTPVEERPMLDEQTLLLIDAVKQKQIAIPEALERPHRLIRAARTHLRTRKPDKYGMLWPTEECIDIRISKSSLNRGLILLNLLLRELEAVGYEAGISDQGTTVIQKDGVRTSISLYERSSRSENPPPKKDAPWWTYEKYSFAPSGELELVLSRWPINERHWKDTSVRKLEARVTDILAEMIESTDLVRQELYKRALEEKEQARLAHEREELRRREMVEQQRKTDLEDQAVRWAAAENLRRFIYQSEIALRQSSEMETDQVTVWVGWALQHADSLDPLTNGRLKVSVNELGEPNDLDQ